MLSLWLSSMKLSPEFPHDRLALMISSDGVLWLLMRLRSSLHPALPRLSSSSLPQMMACCCTLNVL
eukprot:12891632-Prorocentrum_lima.AAC.1